MQKKVKFPSGLLILATLPCPKRQFDSLTSLPSLLVFGAVSRKRLPLCGGNPPATPPFVTAPRRPPAQSNEAPRGAQTRNPTPRAASSPPPAHKSKTLRPNLRPSSRSDNRYPLETMWSSSWKRDGRVERQEQDRYLAARRSSPAIVSSLPQVGLRLPAGRPAFSRIVGLMLFGYLCADRVSLSRFGDEGGNRIACTAVLACGWKA